MENRSSSDNFCTRPISVIADKHARHACTPPVRAHPRGSSARCPPCPARFSSGRLGCSGSWYGAPTTRTAARKFSPFVGRLCGYDRSVFSPHVYARYSPPKANTLTRTNLILAYSWYYTSGRMQKFPPSRKTQLSLSGLLFQKAFGFHAPLWHDSTSDSIQKHAVICRPCFKTA